jgi:hypothetical protein
MKAIVVAGKSIIISQAVLDGIYAQPQAQIRQQKGFFGSKWAERGE